MNNYFFKPELENLSQGARLKFARELRYMSKSCMIKTIIEKYNEIGKVQFKLFSLEYIIEKQNNQVAVYPILYSNRKQYFSNIEEALNNFTIYNESIIENEDRITNII